jgi:hypothetical protein
MPQQNSFDHRPLAQDVLSDGPIQNIAYYLELLPLTGLITSGLLANRPAFGNVGAFYFATDNSTLYFWNGSTWVAAIGGSGAQLNVANTWTMPQIMPVIDSGGAFINVLETAKGNGTTDDTAAIMSLAASGTRLYFPSGKIFNVSQLHFQNFTDLILCGGGLIRGTDNTKHVVWLDTLTRVRVEEGLQIQHQTPGVRGTAYGIYSLGCTDQDISQFEISSTNSAGGLCSGCFRCHIHDAIIHDTGADGWHHTGVSSYFEVDGIRFENTGDDAVPVVSYVTDTNPCHHFDTHDCTIRNSSGRGAVVVGGSYGKIHHHNIDTTHGSGLYIATEASSFHTLACQHIYADNLTIKDANTLNTTGQVASMLMSVETSTYPMIDCCANDCTIIGGRNEAGRVIQTGGAGSVLSAQMSRNKFYGPSVVTTAHSFATVGPDFVDMSDNLSMYASGNGVNIDTTTGLAFTIANKVLYPNQGNNAGAYGLRNRAAAAGEAITVVVPDGTKTALTAAVGVDNPSVAVTSPTPTFGVIAGSGPLELQPNGVSSDALKVVNNASAVNGFEMLGTISGAGPQIQAIGSDTNIGMNLVPKGSGNIIFGGTGNITANNGGVLIWKQDFIVQATNVLITAFWVTSPASAVNGLKVTAAVTGSGPIVAAVGSDTNIPLNLAGKGSGGVQLGSVFFPVQATTVAAPPYVLGGMYFDTTLNKLRIGGATAWETVTST